MPSAISALFESKAFFSQDVKGPPGFFGWADCGVVAADLVLTELAFFFIEREVGFLVFQAHSALRASRGGRRDREGRAHEVRGPPEQVPGR